jgi:hypothetical protein
LELKVWGNIAVKHGTNQCCGSEIRCLFDPWIRDGKNQSGSGMNILDHFSENLEKFLGLKILEKCFIRIRDAGSGIFWPWIRDRKIRIGEKHPGFTTLELTIV